MTESSTDGTLNTDSPPDSPFPSSPSSLSLSNPNSYHVTPATSPALVATPLPATALPITSRMANQDASLTWESDEEPKQEPSQFLREIEVQIDKDDLTSDKQMVNWFKVNLWYGSQADIWFKDLTKTEKDMYDHLVDAFKHSGHS